MPSSSSTSSKKLAAQLASALPAGAEIFHEPADLIPYATDATPGLRCLPVAVVLARHVADVQATLRWARQTRTPVTPRGAGTGLAGGSVPVPGGIVLGLARLNRLLELDPENLTARVEPGLTTEQLDLAAAQKNLLYPPDPGSRFVSTLGGNVSCNSGGLRGLKYGVTRDYVMGLEIVLPDGELLELGNKCVKDVAGYSLRDLFIGSEGTLGIITQILLRLVPRPAARATLLAHFSDMEQAARTGSAILARGIVPCTMEFLDRTTLECVEAYAKIGLPTDPAALLLLETDGHPAAVADEIARMEAICHELGATRVQRARDEAEGARLASARRSAFAALARAARTTILEDVTVPRSRLAEMVGSVQEIARRHRLRVGVFGHLGDGNLHPTILTDESDLEEMKRVHLAMTEIFHEAARLGGTITGEHGVGLAKKPYLSVILSPVAFRLLREVKKSLDPDGLLNPGKIFDLSPHSTCP